MILLSEETAEVGVIHQLRDHGEQRRRSKYKILRNSGLVVYAGVRRSKAGTIHSGLRSITMDTWKPQQLEKMKLGGNGKFRAYLEKSAKHTSTRFLCT